MSTTFPLLHRRPFDGQSEFPEYPVWISFTTPYTERMADCYFGCQLDGLRIGLNTTLSEDAPSDSPVNRLYLCRMGTDGFHWAGPNSYFVRYFSNPEKLLDTRDWILTNLPSVLMMEALR